MHMQQLNFNNFIMGYPYHTIVVVSVQPLIIFFRRYIFLSIVRKTVRELLFEGYEDDVLEVGMDMSDYDEEGEVNMEKFGWFYDVSTILIWRISVK